jgi:hypothetical protein
VWILERWRSSKIARQEPMLDEHDANSATDAIAKRRRGIRAAMRPVIREC